MKKLAYILLGVLTLSIHANAQKGKKNSGAIAFETTIDPAAIMAASGVQVTDQMKARIPSSTTLNFELLFNATNASYMPVEDTEDSNGAGGGGNGGGMGRMMQRFGGAGGNREYYYTFANKSLVEVFDLNDTTYYMPSKLTLALPNPLGNFTRGQKDSTIKTEAPKLEVVKSDSTKQILGYNCHLAIVKSTRPIKLLGMDKNVVEEIRIWYTTELGFDFSPNPNYWTEGAVLALESKGNNSIAKSIDYRNVSAKDVTAPKKAKLITPEEYKAKMANMMKRFRQNRPGGGIQMRNSGNN